MEAGEKYVSRMGQYPVISMTLKGGKQADYETAFLMLKRQITDEYYRHLFILKDESLEEYKERYLAIMRGKAADNEYNDALKFLSQCLEKYYGKKVIILIDEYDVPLENAYMCGFYEEMIAFIRSLFESSLKTNSSLEFAVITGCLRISKESIFTGYFRKVSERIDERTKQLYVTLTIPNEEVKYIFRTKILGWFDEKVKARDRSKLFHALVNLDVETVEEEIVDMLLETISFNDAYESFYHGFLAGILSGMKGYIVKSNREGGTGRSDLYIKPVTRRKPAYVLEFKAADKFKYMDKAADEALLQIEDRKYVQELEDDGYETVYRYGIAFCGKDCLVKLEEKE